MVPHLVEHLLKEYAEANAAVSGQPAEPLWIGRRGPKHMKGKDIWPFAMGGAGYCMDHNAAVELARQSLVDECTAAQQPDDMTIGLVMQRQNVALRHTPQFHSQCEQPYWVPPTRSVAFQCCCQLDFTMQWIAGEVYNRHLEDTILWDTEQRRVRRQRLILIDRL